MPLVQKERAIQDLGDLLNTIYGAVEAGISRARDYIDARGVIYSPRFDAHSHAQLLRDCVFDMLNQASVQSRFVMERLDNSGISIFYREYHLKLWKAAKDGIHPPGHSHYKVEFLNQRLPRQLHLAFNDFRILHPWGEPIPVQFNLCAIWSMNTLMELKQIDLVQSKSATPSWVKEDWRYPLPHPLAASAPLYGLPAPTLFDEGMDVEDIELRDEDEESGQQQ